MAFVGGCSADTPDTSDGDDTSIESEAISGSVAEWSVNVARASAPAGEVTFEITNDGTTLHEFLVVRTDVALGSIPLEGDRFSEDDDSLSVVNEIPEFAVGTTESLTVELEAGKYQLVCNIPGHYENGMHAAFMVT